MVRNGEKSSGQIGAASAAAAAAAAAPFARAGSGNDSDIDSNGVSGGGGVGDGIGDGGNDGASILLRSGKMWRITSRANHISPFLEAYILPSLWV